MPLGPEQLVAHQTCNLTLMPQLDKQTRGLRGHKISQVRPIVRRLADVWQPFTLEIGVVVFMRVISSADMNGNETWLTAHFHLLHREPGSKCRLTQLSLRRGA